MPEKVFGHNWIELRHESSGLVLSFNCADALLRWSELSLSLIDMRRSGLSAWSGWTFDAAELRGAWEQSSWSGSTTYSKREEWDWCYRTDYCGMAHRGDEAAGACARRAAELQQHVLIRALKPSGGTRGPLGCADAPQLEWTPISAAELVAISGEEAAWDPEEAITEKTTKLYEDHLAELGVRCARARRHEPHVHVQLCGLPARIPAQHLSLYGRAAARRLARPQPPCGAAV